jgi:anti-sigma B factor antagonist
MQAVRTARDGEASSDGASVTTASETDHPAIGLSGFRVETELAAPRMTLALSGELDIASAPSLERAIGAAPWPRLTELVVDLSGVTFIDSAGLSVLIRTSRRAAAAGMRFSVVGVPEQPRKLFTIAGVTDALNVQD